MGRKGERGRGNKGGVREGERGREERRGTFFPYLSSLVRRVSFLALWARINLKRTNKKKEGKSMAAFILASFL